MSRFIANSILLPSLLIFAVGCDRSPTEEQQAEVRAEYEREITTRRLEKEKREQAAEASMEQSRNKLSKIEMDLRHSLGDRKPEESFLHEQGSDTK